ncbi:MULTISPECIES: flagellar hook-basal body complex protein FliE [Pseudomonadota]|jgi:flagellar hook-basal body complex protein FliE|uniref:Flagellar hook-basal body complex protein FliE n=1 Tax=Marinobacter salarius TaxID=1420917 RepID=W5YR34_9GAMM|nr:MULTISPECIES: flagellar hook-basal body complex protein FliE [Marinobacter]AHI31500.1 flagellar hook-basal body protein FliE [Marinobacter salarius]ARM83609.1 flagellar hook-basal body complex protein FliE [Marinobacter salarius]AZR42448.1 flagellar hook-basal body complex protein FliE [Marinobacter salarius]KXJ44780.1 MAG: flagellar hook-basal body protein FliE [Marinobacter sp. Hex_13]MAB51316.1 flagellar hook-basal body complex protein FliE [Marinobacter sp.]|tara:strand:- start:1983 stop:2351 length:369 start_codon:yes stop_codon:yes gene_type:complete
MVQRADINSVLSEIRNMRSQMMENQRVEQDNNIRGRMDGPSKVQETSDTPKFSDMLSQAVGSVNELQQTSSDMKTAYEMGDPNMDISRVMIASEKASISFEALTQVRNRVVKAYEDIMNMPV